jgi:hypothetical protein
MAKYRFSVLSVFGCFNTLLLYLVTNLKPNKTPEIEALQNPFKLLNEGKLIFNIASYDLKLLAE